GRASAEASGRNPPPAPPPRRAPAADERRKPEDDSPPQPEPATGKRASPAQVQETIDQLRAEVAGLNQRLEQSTL
ncbi:MAG TPA: hypothetical protein DD643_01130, partial [Synechococcus sp. UBA8638]|nr:hypothetical protein [Synechococcus sp. UBA8638]